MRWADDVIRRTRESYQRGLNANKAERIRLETINTTLRAALESREASLSSLRVEDQPAYIRLREENARLVRELDEHEHHVASHCPKPGHFCAPVMHACKACNDTALARIATLEARVLELEANLAKPHVRLLPPREPNIAPLLEDLDALDAAQGAR